MTSKVIIGLTTTPIRLNLIEPTILSLLAQTKIPDEIVLTIPKVSARFNTIYEIKNAALLKLIECKRVILNEIEHDYGPATKFVGLLLRNYSPNDVLIWVDDDILYSNKLVETLTNCLYRCSKINHPRIAIGFSGFNFNKNGQWVKVKKHLKRVEIIEGFCGVATFKLNMPTVSRFEKYGLRPQTHASLQTIHKFEKAQFLSDDFTISDYFKQNEILTLLCYYKECNFNNCIEILDLGNKTDALHNQPAPKPTDGNTYNYNLLRGFYN